MTTKTTRGQIIDIATDLVNSVAKDPRNVRVYTVLNFLLDAYDVGYADGQVNWWEAQDANLRDKDEN